MVLYSIVASDSDIPTSLFNTKKHKKYIKSVSKISFFLQIALYLKQTGQKGSCSCV